jgi:hypothetical protein
VNFLYIYHHLGLGDHIICNGLVREVSRRYDRVYLFVKEHNWESVSFMYRDVSNLECLCEKDDRAVEVFIKRNKIDNVLKIGFQRLDRRISFDQSFYNQAGVDFAKRWTSFYVMRDQARERNLFNYFNLVEKEYIFLHEDRDRKFVLKREHIQNQELRVVQPVKGVTDNIFDYCYILQNAREIHCIDSSFRLLADSLELNSRLLFHHTYVKVPNKGLVSSSKLGWTEVG